MNDPVDSAPGEKKVPLSKDILFLSMLLAGLNIAVAFILYFAGDSLVSSAGEGTIIVSDPTKLFRFFFVWLFANMGIGTVMAIVLGRARESKQ